MLAPSFANENSSAWNRSAGNPSARSCDRRLSIIPGGPQTSTSGELAELTHELR